MGRRDKHVAINRDVLLERVMKENARLAHENVKLQKDVRVLRRVLSKFNRKFNGIPFILVDRDKLN